MSKILNLVQTRSKVFILGSTEKLDTLMWQVDSKSTLIWNATQLDIRRKYVLKKLGIFRRNNKNYIWKFLEGAKNFMAVSLRKI